MSGHSTGSASAKNAGVRASKTTACASILKDSRLPLKMPMTVGMLGTEGDKIDGKLEHQRYVLSWALNELISLGKGFLT